MSTIQRVKGAETSVKTAITTEQSQKLIQTMLTMSFGCIAFLRGLFADESFIDQKFVPGKFEPDYCPTDQKNKTESIRVKTLVKGKSPQVDLFLRWIDEGALDAIKRGFLKCLSFSIFLDETNPNDLQEVYSFFFDYQNDEIKVNINNTSSTISLLNSRKMLQQLMRRFIIITQSLDPLPEQKFMSMRLLFNDDCPKDYQPPLFRDASNESATIKTNSKISKYSAGSLHTGVHDVSLSVISSNTSMSEDDSMNDEREIVEIDPFAVPKPPPKVPISAPHKPKLTTPKPAAPKIEEQSQTTTMLKSFLESSQDQIVPTQAISKIKCECGSNKPIEDSILLVCSSCGSQMHIYCYGFQKSKSLICFSCRSKSLSIPLHDNIQLLTNVRKLFRLLMRSYMPQSISEIHKMMGFSKEENIHKTIDAISYLLIHDLIIITNEPFTKRGTSIILKCSNEVIIDQPGIFRKGNVLLEMGSKVAFTFVLALKGPIYVNYDAIKTRYRKLLFEDTLEKCLIIDDELKNFKIGIKGENDDDDIDDIVNSSMNGTPAEDKKSFEVSDHFSNLKLNNDDTLQTQDPILMSPFQESIQKKRVLSDDEDEETLKPENYYTSQPVLTFPRYKKSKTSVSNRVLDSIGS